MRASSSVCASELRLMSATSTSYFLSSEANRESCACWLTDMILGRMLSLAFKSLRASSIPLRSDARACRASKSRLRDATTTAGSSSPVVTMGACNRGSLRAAASTAKAANPSWCCASWSITPSSLAAACAREALNCAMRSQYDFAAVGAGVARNWSLYLARASASAWASAFSALAAATSSSSHVRFSSPISARIPCMCVTPPMVWISSRSASSADGSADAVPFEDRGSNASSISGSSISFRRVRAVSVAAASRSRASLVTPSTASVYLDRDFALESGTSEENRLSVEASRLVGG
mmetsp:Transcript_28848/g.77698  ORF Transcript_28848/g.77698 Transcript_28848/m.77698 type:complete len:294 (+) Transcript_28848:1338-2219(+)